MENCIFCKIAAGEFSSHKVYEDEHCFAFLDINPKNAYHTLVIPKKHYTGIFDIPEDEAVFLMKAVKKVVSLYSEKLGLTDLQIINNNGKNAQQEVPHLHFHILPRYKDDGQNFAWPQTRKDIGEKLDELLEKLK